VTDKLPAGVHNLAQAQAAADAVLEHVRGAVEEIRLLPARSAVDILTANGVIRAS
jgi:hypothetical protein